ncbi:PepSY domain-containing protein [Paramicrobacterium chengjingii]|uniref:PepSY domain-containing protein n=1 Tax=Paramicrobacterium chengjingii TaxID=2769067 RepID=A0ABX6YJE8_9MICO|nr:PepSY domain-containing protein [Microbacterium chengjingii]QPZ38917.1 PepSY domain-containing protein [Microbacterium chengjingii]
MRLHSIRTTAITAAALALGLTLAGCADDTGSTSAADGDSTSGSSQSSENSSGNAEGSDASTTKRGADLATTDFAIEWEDAVETAQSAFDGDLAEIELDWSRDRYAYSIELVSDSEEYEVRIDATTGEKFGERTEKIESDDVAEKTSEVIDLNNIVSWDDALATALDAQDGTVNEWKLEGTESGPQWQFDIDADSGEDYEVTINAETGELLTTDD